MLLTAPRTTHHPSFSTNRDRLFLVFTSQSQSVGWHRSSFTVLLLLLLGHSLLSQTTWDGSDNTDWFAAGNWSAGVPDAADNVTIPGGMPNQPTIGAAAALAKSVTVQSGAVLTIASAGSLEINGSSSGGFLNQGTTENNGTLTIGATSSNGLYGIRNEGTFNNNPGGEINIDRSTLHGISNYSTFTNWGNIHIGQSVGVTGNGITNQIAAAVFNHNAGEILVDRWTTVAVYNAVYNSIASSTFNNAADITIGAATTGGNRGIHNNGNFHHTAGTIAIDNTLLAGMLNSTDATFNNSSTLTIGAVASVGANGLENYGAFNNQTGGVISIDRSTDKAIYNFSGTFTNENEITIGANASVGFYGVDNNATFNNNNGVINIDNCGFVGLRQNTTGSFTNHADIIIGANTSVDDYGLIVYNYFLNAGNIQIDRSTFAGMLPNQSTCNFQNQGVVTIGANASVGSYGIFNSNFASVTNQACGEFRLFASYSQQSNCSFTNNGLFRVNTTAVHSNTAVLTNNGILEYLQGNPIPNVVNNDFIVAPINGGAVIPNALQKGGALSFTAANTWYRDAALSIPAGTYNQAANTFTPTAGLPQCTANTLYFSISDNANGCPRTVSIRVTTNDATPPSITCPANQTRSTDPNQCQASVTYATPTATDNCAMFNGQPVWVSGGTAPTPSGSNSASTFQKGTTTVQWKATDAVGLTKTCTFRVTVNDTEAPAITCPNGQSVNTAANTCVSAPVTYATPTAVDNCPGMITVVRIGGPASGSSFPLGATNVTWRAIDAAGRSSTCSFSVAVTDAQAPAITCPNNIAVTSSGIPCQATVTYTTPTATDNCGVQSVFMLSGLVSGSSFPAGTTTNVWRAIDNSGGSATCSFTVTVGCGAASEQGGVSREQSGRGDLIVPTSSGWSNLGLRLTPNPATTEVQMEVSGLSENSGGVTVIDARGRVVWQQSNILSPTSKINVAEWPSGVYFVTLRAEGQTVTKRLVVQRL